MEVVEALLSLIVLGVITYFALGRMMPNLNRVSIWLWWSLMMMPAVVWSARSVIVGDNKSLPAIVAIGPLLICISLCYLLVRQNSTQQSDRDPQNDSDRSQNSAETETPNRQVDTTTLCPITPEQETTLRNCFPWNIYYLQHIDYRPQAILCRGRLKTTDELAYQKIEENIKKAFGDRFFLIFQESFRGQPFFALVPNPWQKSPDRQEEELFRPGLALTLLLATLLTTSYIGALLSGLSVSQLEANPLLIWQGLSYSLALLLILGVHELGHYLATIHYHIKSTLPYFIPVPFFLGTFGAFSQRREPIPHRKALFDISIAGPLAGFIVTIPLLIWGLSLSELVSLSDRSSFVNFNFDNLDPRFSFIFAVLSKLVFGDRFIPGTGINLHPLAIASYIGLLFTALNLLPIGQFDGGNIIHAIFGQQAALIVSQVTRFLILLFILVYFYSHPTFWIWIILVLFMPIIDRPALNDVTDLNDGRDWLGLFSLTILLAIVLPLPSAIAGWINI
jgi:membrane-associated protease RseP (regulator of RpoE activity)